MAKEICSVSTDGISYRGYAQNELMGTFGFAKTVCLLVCGRMPKDSEAEMLDALLLSAADHGEKAPSAHLATAAASTRAPLSSSVAAGLIAIGDVHGGAARECSKLLCDGLSARETVELRSREKKRVPGFGHRLYTDFDPRARMLLEKAEKLGIAGDACRKLQEIEGVLEERLGRRLVINIDGSHAAILADMGWEPDMCEAVFIIARTSGLCAHVLADRKDRRPLEFISKLQRSGNEK